MRDCNAARRSNAPEVFCDVLPLAAIFGHLTMHGQIGKLHSSRIRRSKAIPERHFRSKAGLGLLVRMNAGGNNMHDTHLKAIKRHELAADAHGAAAEHNGKGNYSAADWHSNRVPEYSNQAYKLAKV
jgi:prepilin-type processing-associated H-X9-DG protein